MSPPKSAARIRSTDPYIQRKVKVAAALAGRVEERLLHMGPAPTFTVFTHPDFLLAAAPVAGPTAAWTAGDVQQDVRRTWLGIVGPAVQLRGIDFSTWTDHTNLRPTLLALVGLRDDYAHDGHVLLPALLPQNVPPQLARAPRTMRRLGAVYDQLNAPFGSFAMTTLASSSEALASRSAGDAKYRRIETALGRRMSPDEPPLCFGCHSTAASTDGQFHPDRLIPGVTCEACHGPGAQHVAQMSLEHDAKAPTLILNPARLSPADSVDFCGACHRTSADVTLSSITGIFNLRFPAYRLEQSRCWGNGDARLTCIACHDAHKPRVQDAAFYDKVCVSCHSPASGAPKERATSIGTCKVSNHDCVSCHMPKYTIPSMHTDFTDHKIAVHGDQFAE